MAPVSNSGSTSGSSGTTRTKGSSSTGKSSKSRSSSAAPSSSKTNAETRSARQPKDKAQLSRAGAQAPTSGADVMAQGLASSFAAQPPSQSTLSKGTNGPDVKNLQKTLNEKLGTKLTLDGDFGPNTQNAVRRFQEANGLSADGVVGPQTYAKLGSSAAAGKQPDAAKAGDPAPDGKSGKFRSPIPGAKINSNFGPRKAPKAGASKNHKGVDIKGTIGTPVGASQGGVVTKSGRLGKYGNIVEVRHPDGTSTRYAHLNARDVKIGQKVKAGQEIGQVGQTGNVTGPHLHFEIRDRQGRALNPMDHIGR